MEEDIKILESECYYLEELGYLRENNHFIRFNQALGNLLKGYRELKKEYERVRTGRNWLSERISAQIATPELLDKILEEDYIPKSKIKEKIKELYEDKDSKYYDMFLEQRDIEKTISVLKELMEDK